jgi:polyphosphate kinase
MTRNFHNRVELVFPIYEVNIKKHLSEILDLYWKDNTKSWRLNSDGSYSKLEVMEGETPFCAQNFFVETTYSHRNKSRK